MHSIFLEVPDILLVFMRFQLTISMPITLLEHAIISFSRRRLKLPPSAVTSLMHLASVLCAIHKSEGAFALFDVLHIVTLISVSICVAIQATPVFLIALELAHIHIPVRIS